MAILGYLYAHDNLTNVYDCVNDKTTGNDLPPRILARVVDDDQGSLIGAVYITTGDSKNISSGGSTGTRVRLTYATNYRFYKLSDGNWYVNGVGRVSTLPTHIRGNNE